ncbi:MAG: ferritin-like domain-containing protein [Gammaproteobacteria bacterium]|nr:ferritin-like domain-containing protein [Gammaproteobacteria bacterium]
MRVRVGSTDHRRLLARFFIDTYHEYVPEKLDWPALSATELTRLTGLPFWQEAVSTEAVTSATVAAAAALEADIQVRKAIELQGFEEQRHARLLTALTSHYGIPIEPPPPFTPRSLEDDFLFAGFGECFDSFFAFGLFALVRESGYFPPQLVRIFEPVMQEEARHILFFVNWVKARRAQLPWRRRPAFRARCGWIILKQIASRVRTARALGNGPKDSSENFTLIAHQEVAAPVTVHALLGKCLEENDRRLSQYDPRLLRPRLVPGLARLLYRLLPASI